MRHCVATPGFNHECRRCAGALRGLSPTSPIRASIAQFPQGKSLICKGRGGRKRRKSAVVPTKSILKAVNVPIIGGHHVPALQGEHFRAPKWLRLLRPTPKGRHYSGIGGTGPAVILGGGWAGNSSFSFSSKRLSSGSGSV